MTMQVEWDGFDLDTPDWNALYFIDEMLRQSRGPHYVVRTAERTDSPDSPHPNGPKVVAHNTDADLIVTIFCDDYPGEHRTWCSIVVSGTDEGAVVYERDSLTGQIKGLGLN